MANSARTSGNRFDKSKKYFGRIFQYGKHLYDWDVNEHSEEIRYWFLSYVSELFGASARLSGFTVEESPVSNTNDVFINPGSAIIAGRLISQESTTTLGSYTNNYVVTGEITSITEITGGVKYGLVDSEKRFTSAHKLTTCRIRFLSGDLSGLEFNISSLNGQTFTVDGDLSNLALNDSYVIYPRLLSTPTEDDTVDTIYLVSWWEDISPQEDNNIENRNTRNSYNNLSTNALWDKFMAEGPSHRKQLRFCFWPNYGATPTVDPMEGFASIRVATITRDTGVSAVTAATIDDLTDDPVDFVRRSLSSIASQIANGFSSLIVDNLTVNTTLVNNGTTDLNGSVTVDGNCVFTGDVTFNGSIVQDGDLTLSGGLSVSGDSDFQDIDCVNIDVSGTLKTNVIRPYTGSDISLANCNAYFSSIYTSQLSANGGSSINCADHIFLDSGKYLKADTVYTQNISTQSGTGDIVVGAETRFTKSIVAETTATFNTFLRSLGSAALTAVTAAQPDAEYINVLQTGMSFLRSKDSDGAEVVSNVTDFWSATIKWDSGGSDYAIQDSVNITEVGVVGDVCVVSLDGWDNVDDTLDVPLNIQVTPIFEDSAALTAKAIHPVVRTYLDTSTGAVWVMIYDVGVADDVNHMSFSIRVSKMNNFNITG